MSVILRRKLGKKGESLYLEINHQGKRTYEFLKLILRPAKTSQEKAFNKDILNLAEQVRALRQLDLDHEQHGLISASKKKKDFHQYLDKFSRTKKYHNRNNFRLCGVKLKEYAPVLTFENINPEFCEGFRDHLLNHVSNNTAYTYYSKFISVLNQAVRERILRDNPANNIEPIKKGGVAKGIS